MFSSLSSRWSFAAGLVGVAFGAPGCFSEDPGTATVGDSADPTGTGAGTGGSSGSSDGSSTSAPTTSSTTIAMTTQGPSGSGSTGTFGDSGSVGPASTGPTGTGPATNACDCPPNAIVCDGFADLETNKWMTSGGQSNELRLTPDPVSCDEQSLELRNDGGDFYTQAGLELPEFPVGELNTLAFDVQKAGACNGALGNRILQISLFAENFTTLQYRFELFVEEGDAASGHAIRLAAINGVDPNGEVVEEFALPEGEWTPVEFSFAVLGNKTPAEYSARVGDVELAPSSAPPVPVTPFGNVRVIFGNYLGPGTVSDPCSIYIDRVRLTPTP